MSFLDNLFNKSNYSKFGITEAQAKEIDMLDEKKDDKVNNKSIFNIIEDAKKDYDKTKGNKKIPFINFINNQIGQNEISISEISSKIITPEKIADELIDEIFKFGRSANLDKPISKINENNVIEVIEKYQEKSKTKNLSTGAILDTDETLFEAILDERIDNSKKKEYITHITNTLIKKAETLGIKTDKIKKEFSSAINNALTGAQGFQDASELNKLVKNLSATIKKEKTFDDINEIIKTREKNTKRILSIAKLKGYKSNLNIKNKQIKNQYYTGGLYDITYSGLNVTIKNHDTGKTHHLDLYSLLDNMNDKEIVDFLLYIQKQPAEVLEDLAIEMDDILSPTGRNMHTMDNQEFVAGGYYRPSNDSIVTSPAHLVHELGHAIDYSGKENKASTTMSKQFMATFKKELANYKKLGNVQYDYDDSSTWKHGKEYNYCTANERELFAEAYTLAMTGDCRSKEVITKYFPETFKVAIKIIAQSRQKSDLDRRHTPQREIVATVTSFLDKLKKND